MSIAKRFAAGLALLGASLAFTTPGVLWAQDGVPVADAEAFIGDWELPLQTDMGPFEMTIDIEDANGQVAAAVGALQGTQAVEDISMEGEDLILSYSMDAQGQAIPVVITLRPDGENLGATLDAAAGMFVASGTATRTDG